MESGRVKFSTARDITIVLMIGFALGQCSGQTQADKWHNTETIEYKAVSYSYGGMGVEPLWPDACDERMELYKGPVSGHHARDINHDGQTIVCIGVPMVDR